MSSCVIFGGTGYIGSNLFNDEKFQDRFDTIYLVDILPPNLKWISENSKLVYIKWDVRKSILDPILLDIRPTWIFNFAAIHREPGHRSIEFYQTNIFGAINICEYADKVKCKNLFFTSSISVYGPCLNATDESSKLDPISAYGGSKYPAELIHKYWLEDCSKKRCVIVRPGVIYGPGDPGNILRMIKAIKRGYFVFPGKKSIIKSYGYIFGLLESIHFTMNKEDRLIVYNYCEYPTESIGALANKIKSVLGIGSPVVSLPKTILIPISKILRLILGEKNPIHPLRVKKASTPTNIIPKYLIDNGFNFRFDFRSSLEHWRKVKEFDFN